jgi:hypothetical protein
MTIFDAEEFRDRAACRRRPGLDDVLLSVGSVGALRHGVGELRYL